MTRVPVLASSCASAATAAEVRFRIDRPIEEGRRTTVIALDPGAARIAAGAAGVVSDRVTFLTMDRSSDPARVGSEVQGSDLVVLVATSEMDSSTVSALGQVDHGRVPAVGLVVGAPLERVGAMAALRDRTLMLVASETPSDLSDILSDLRA